jgi:cardiolipin synthase
MHRRRGTQALAAVLLLALAGCASASAPTPAVTGAKPQLIVEPGPGSAPVVDAIDAARSSVELTMYELDDPAVDAALIAASQRHVAVRVLLDHGYYGEGSPINARTSAQLRAGGVAVRWASTRYALTHQKTLSVDGRESLIMTLNLTPRYYASDRDLAIVDRQSDDVREIERVFAADWAGRAVSPTSGAGDLLWSPGAQPAELALIAGARRRLEVEDEEMSDPQITASLCAAARRRVQVRIVMTDNGEWHAAFAQLAACGAEVRTYSPSAPLYIHAKEIIVDESHALIGSQNFSRASLTYNRELGIDVSVAPIIRRLEQSFASDFAGGQPYP